MDAPKDINLEKRKNIIRDELKKLIGNPIKEKVEEMRRVKQKVFDKKKARRKVALISKKKNWR